MSSTFASSTLVRLLAPWAPAQPEAAAGDLAERLAGWVSAFDAIGLQAAQQSIRALGQARPVEGRAPQRLAEDFERARAALAKAIARDPALPNEFTYAPYRRRHFELQRQMEQMIGALRDHVRQALARAATPLRQLAALDVAMAGVIAHREEALLPKVVLALERRFEQLQASHRDALPEGAEDDPAGWRRPGGWLHAFEAEWREALHAELALRLEPVAGLVEASGNELKNFR